jgi:hypothetical protein
MATLKELVEYKANPKKVRLQRRIKKLAQLFRERGIGANKLIAAQKQLHKCNGIFNRENKWVCHICGKELPRKCCVCGKDIGFNPQIDTCSQGCTKREQQAFEYCCTPDDCWWERHGGR